MRVPRPKLTEPTTIATGAERCPRCGGRLFVDQEDDALYCLSCGHRQGGNDTVKPPVLSSSMQMLDVHRNPGYYAAGASSRRVREKETIKGAAWRKPRMEEHGIPIGDN